MMTARYLVINADDFGQSSSINQGIIRAYEAGILTSASLMVHWPASAEAVAYSRCHPDLSLGLHVDLGEWLYREDTWLPIYEVVSLDDRAAVVQAVADQLDTFRKLVGSNPTHIDSHQHVHRNEPTRTVLIEMARQLDVPLRLFTEGINYCGDFYGQTGKGLKIPQYISVDWLINILRRIPIGLTELSCHPGIAVGIDSMYCAEREIELETLCDVRVREAIADEEIELCSFWDSGRILQG